MVITSYFHIKVSANMVRYGIMERALKDEENEPNLSFLGQTV
jgi:hypothetical protein